MNENTIFWKVFTKRSALCLTVIFALLFSCILRVTVIATDSDTQAAAMQNRLKITVKKQRRTIFDCNGNPLTNAQRKIIAAVSPTPKAVTAISGVLSGEKLEQVLSTLKSGKPAVSEVPEEIDCDGIICTRVSDGYAENRLAAHILGYTDSENHGATGLEAAYDSLLYTTQEIYLSYECDGKGRPLEGTVPEIHNDTSVEAGGVVSTIDINIQSLAEAAADALSSGAVIVAEAATGKIRAMVSRPEFNSERLSEYLNKPDSPLLNRAINAYNVGSVFKPCVAAAGIEAKKDGFLYTCTGSCKIIDRSFKCHKYDGHGLMSLHTALANSCNTFFYNFAFNIGQNAIYEKARSLRFGTSLKLCDGIYTAKGALPSLDSLKNPAALANFSIGQGELLLTPVAMLTLYTAIATDGSYYIPSLTEGTLTNGKLTEYKRAKPTRVMSAKTAITLKEALTAVITEGTGEAARPEKTTAAGKTATAQTGKFENGVEICQGWFCGFFPAEKPQYVIIVFSENTKKQTAPCGKIFAQVSDGITRYLQRAE